MNFTADAKFDHVLPRSDEYYIDSLILPSAVLCTLECNERKPLCIGVLYKSNSKTYKLLKCYLTQVNIYKQEYGDYWIYYPMKQGVDDGLWIQYTENKHWYFKSEYKRTWQEARVECLLRNSHLVEPTDIGENDFLRQNFLEIDSCVPAKPYECTLWTGLNDHEEEGHYRWDSSNFTVTFSNWYRGQPDGSKGKNCVDILHNGKWNDRICWHNTPFVCEMT